MSKSNTRIIEPGKKRFDIRQVLEYKDLIYMLVKRDFIIYYKQTILGPLWYLIQPIFTTITYIIIFGRLANLGTNGIPQPLFYFSGTIMWTFFSGVLTNTSRTFLDNKNIFGKVYFPRLVVPVATVCVLAIKFLIQFVFFLIIYAVYIVKDGTVDFSWQVIFTPLWILWIGLSGMAFGMVIASVTTKYRDIALVLNYILSLCIYITPIAYSFFEVPTTLQYLLLINPMTAPIECFRHLCFGTNQMPTWGIGISLLETIIVLIIGMKVFARSERNFVDII